MIKTSNSCWELRIRYFWSAALVCNFILLSTAQTYALVTVTPTSINIGAVRLGTESKRSITLTNTGSDPATILEAKPQCTACTKLDFQPQLLEPGKAMTFTVRFAPENSSAEGPVQSKILITTSDKEQPNLLIPLTGYVATVAALSPWELTAQPQLPGSTLRRELELVNVSDKELKVLYATSDAGGPRLEG